MLWLALHLPGLPLEALPIDAPGEASQAPCKAGEATQAADALRSPELHPCCVIEQRRVRLANRAAQALGIRPGMSSATAASLAPQVRQLAREPLREAAFVQALALALGRYTPQLVLQADGVLLQVQASLRLFGGIRALMVQVQATAAACGAHVRVALAPTATGASLLARVPRARRRALQPERLQRLLDALPLAPALQVLQAAPALAEMLHTLGCRRLTQVRALPRAGLQRRGGTGLLQALDRAYGQIPDPQPWFEPPERFALSLELMHRADDAAQLVFAAQRLVLPLAGWLARQWLAVSRLTLRLRHESSRHGAPPDTLLQLTLASPCREAPQLMLLLRERLQRCVLPAPVYGLELHLDEAVSHAGTAGELLPDSSRPEQAFAGLLDRLTARLGPERVRRLQVLPDHRPERASHTLPATAPVSPSAAHATPDTAPMQQPVRPLWLLEEPLRLPERDGLPVHGSPLLLRSRPERIEAGWFDGRLVCRDYHLAEGADHRLRWIFRARPVAAGGAAPAAAAAWYLHGLFG